MSASQSDPFRQQREAMVELIRRRGIDDAQVLQALLDVRRDKFVLEASADSAYEDSPLPIGHDQTISEPYVVAIMVSALQLRSRDRVLEIGTGSGYAAAVLSRIVGEVFTVERVDELATAARKRLKQHHFDNVQVRHGDGTDGWVEHAPYDAITVAAGGPKVPEPLFDQLRIGGRLVIPVGATRQQQDLMRLTKLDDGVREENLGPVRFVPLLGVQGW